MADMDMYLVWESARSALKSVRSGAPRLTTVPRSACTLVTMPGAIGVTLTSRYALAITLPGTVTTFPALTAVAGGLRGCGRWCSSYRSCRRSSPFRPAKRHRGASGAQRDQAERPEPEQAGPDELPAPSDVRRIASIVFRVQGGVHLLAGTDGCCPLDLDPRVVDQLERVRIAHLDLDIPALFGDDVQYGYATKLIGLSHDGEVAAGDITDAAAIDGEPALGGVELGEGRGDLLADDQLGAFALALGGLGFRRGGRDIALVLISYGHHDRHTPTHVVEVDL